MSSAEVTGLPALAAVEQLAVRVGSPITGAAAVGRANGALADASALVRAHARQQWIAGPVPDAIVAVVLAVARRSFTNPDAAVQRTVGGVSTSFDRATVAAYLTDAEQAVVARYRPAARTGLWVQPVGREHIGGDTLWAEDTFGAEPFPVGTVGDDGREVW